MCPVGNNPDKHKERKSESDSCDSTQPQFLVTSRYLTNQSRSKKSSKKSKKSRGEVRQESLEMTSLLKEDQAKDTVVNVECSSSPEGSNPFNKMLEQENESDFNDRPLHEEASNKVNRSTQAIFSEKSSDSSSEEDYPVSDTQRKLYEARVRQRQLEQKLARSEKELNKQAKREKLLLQEAESLHKKASGWRRYIPWFVAGVGTFTGLVCGIGWHYESSKNKSLQERADASAKAATEIGNGYEETIAILKTSSEEKIKNSEDKVKDLKAMTAAFQERLNRRNCLNGYGVITNTTTNPYNVTTENHEIIQAIAQINAGLTSLTHGNETELVNGNSTYLMCRTEKNNKRSCVPISNHDVLAQVLLSDHDARSKLVKLMDYFEGNVDIKEIFENEEKSRAKREAEDQAHDQHNRDEIKRHRRSKRDVSESDTSEETPASEDNKVTLHGQRNDMHDNEVDSLLNQMKVTCKKEKCTSIPHNIIVHGIPTTPSPTTTTLSNTQNTTLSSNSTLGANSTLFNITTNQSPISTTTTTESATTEPQTTATKHEQKEFVLKIRSTTTGLCLYLDKEGNISVSRGERGDDNICPKSKTAIGKDKFCKLADIRYNQVDDNERQESRTVSPTTTASPTKELSFSALDTNSTQNFTGVIFGAINKFDEKESQDSGLTLFKELNPEVEVPSTYSCNIDHVIGSRKKTRRKDEGEFKKVSDTGGKNYETFWQEWSDKMSGITKKASIHHAHLQHMNVKDITDLRALDSKIKVKLVCEQRAIDIGEWVYESVYKLFIEPKASYERKNCYGFEEKPKSYDEEFKGKDLNGELMKEILSLELYTNMKYSDPVKGEVATSLGCGSMPMAVWVAGSSGSDTQLHRKILDALNLRGEHEIGGLCTLPSIIIWGDVYSIDNACNRLLDNFRTKVIDYEDFVERHRELSANMKLQQPWSHLCHSYQVLTQEGYKDYVASDMYETAENFVYNNHPTVGHCSRIVYHRGWLGEIYDKSSREQIINHWKSNGNNKLAESDASMKFSDFMQIVVGKAITLRNRNIEHIGYNWAVGRYAGCGLPTYVKHIMKYYMAGEYSPRYWPYAYESRVLGAQLLMHGVWEPFYSGPTRRGRSGVCDVNYIFQIGEESGTIRSLVQKCSGTNIEFNKAVRKIFSHYQILKGITLETCLPSACRIGSNDCWLKIDRDLSLYPLDINEDPYKESSDNLMEKKVQSYSFALLKIALASTSDKEFIRHPIWDQERVCLSDKPSDILKERDAMLLKMLKAIFVKTRCGGDFQNPCNNPLQDW